VHKNEDQDDMTKPRKKLFSAAHRKRLQDKLLAEVTKMLTEHQSFMRGVADDVHAIRHSIEVHVQRSNRKRTPEPPATK
jgi:hypothetical protein